MTQTTTRWIDRNMGKLTIACAAGTIACLILYGWLQKQVRDSATAGADARVRQCELKPISDREQRWFHASGVISFEELETYRKGAPSDEECAALGVKVP